MSDQLRADASPLVAGGHRKRAQHLNLDQTGRSVEEPARECDMAHDRPTVAGDERQPLIMRNGRVQLLHKSADAPAVMVERGFEQSCDRARILGKFRA